MLNYNNKEMANIIYTNYFDHINLFNKLKKEGRIVNTPYQNTVSENSFCFNVGMKPSNSDEYKERLLQTIKDVFGITKDSFDGKFYKAIEGAGQEWKTLNVFHSSSLLALLCFYDVSEQNPLSINIEGVKCKFTSSEFEVSNIIGRDKRGKDYSSHIDVKLTGTCGEKCVSLYLESKFSEYVNQRENTSFSYTEDYNSIYTKLQGKIKDLDINIGCDKITLVQTNSKRPVQYWEGFKQMVSHYLGMKNCKDQSDLIYLGEIVYDFRPFKDMQNDFYEDYREIYKQLVDTLEDIETEPQKFKVGKNLLTYQGVFESFNLDERVRELYNL